MPRQTDPGAGEGALGAGESILERECAPNNTPPHQAPELRSYQTDLIVCVAAEIAAGPRRVLVVAPTGSGKTVIAAAIIAAGEGRRGLVIAHRREIVAQTAAKLFAAGVDA